MDYKPLIEFVLANGGIVKDIMRTYGYDPKNESELMGIFSKLIFKSKPFYNDITRLYEIKASKYSNALLPILGNLLGSIGSIFGLGGNNDQANDQSAEMQQQYLEIIAKQQEESNRQQKNILIVGGIAIAAVLTIVLIKVI